jgi:hypothetical protein
MGEILHLILADVEYREAPLLHPGGINEPTRDIRIARWEPAKQKSMLKSPGAP